MDTDDARYERPCRWLLGFAAGIHWVAAALVLRNHVTGAADAVGPHLNLADWLLRLIALPS